MALNTLGQYTAAAEEVVWGVNPDLELQVQERRCGVGAQGPALLQGHPGSILELPTMTQQELVSTTPRHHLRLDFQRLQVHHHRRLHGVHDRRGLLSHQALLGGLLQLTQQHKSR